LDHVAAYQAIFRTLSWERGLPRLPWGAKKVQEVDSQ